MTLSENEVSVAVGILGALIGAGVAWWTAVSVAKWSRTMDLHREFNSERLSKARSEAAAFLKLHWDKSFVEISETDMLETQAVPLWDVVYFYERLWILVRYKQVAARAIPELFGEVFLWWYCVSFRQQLLPANWKSSKDIQALYLWLKSRTNATQWSSWENAQDAAYESLRAKLSDCASSVKSES